MSGLFSSYFDYPYPQLKLFHFKQILNVVVDFMSGAWWMTWEKVR